MGLVQSWRNLRIKPGWKLIIKRRFLVQEFVGNGGFGSGEDLLAQGGGKKGREVFGFGANAKILPTGHVSG